MRRLERIGVLALAAAVAACASGGPRGGTREVEPDAIAKLEAEQRATPESGPVLRALGLAYYKSGRYGDAFRMLQLARLRDPKDGTAALYAGLSAEKLGDFKAARSAYTSYLSYGRTQRVRGQLRARLAALARQELLQEAKTAVANERQLAAQPGDPRTIAVMPFRFTGTDSSLRPLGRGMAELIVNDLAKSKTLTLVERARIQMVLDEIQLGRSGAVDTNTSARAGKLVRAGRLVQGSLTQLPMFSLRIDAALVDVPTSQTTGGASADNRLEQFFAMEKKIVLDLFRALGITLTPEERRAVEERPTRSLAAFLAYSAGLLEQDAGNLDAANRYYAEALRIDPDFAPAAQRQEDVQQIQGGEQITAATVEQTLEAAPEGSVVEAAAAGEVDSPASDEPGGLAQTAQQVVDGVNPSTTENALSASQQSSGTPDPGQQTNNTPGNTQGSGVTSPRGTITVIFVQPRGTP